MDLAEMENNIQKSKKMRIAVISLPENKPFFTYIERGLFPWMQPCSNYKP
jgi:hypothetical protein